MKLTAEQIKLLREKKAELIKRSEEFTDYLTHHRENDTMDGIGTFYTDFVENEKYRQDMKEIDDIEKTLSHSEIVTERDLDHIEVGTAFYAHFVGDEEAERVLLVEKGIAHTPDYHMVSLDSDFGKAVLGKTDGDTVVYTVEATGRKIGVTIDSIDRMRKNYTHFIREKRDTDRMSSVVRSELSFLKQYDREEYDNRQRPTASQKLLIMEELKREKDMTPSRKSFLNRVLARPTAIAPTNDTIGVGSRVTFFIQNEERNDLNERTVEIINRAYSTELEDHYVESITPLGNALMGLKVGEYFSVPKKNQPPLKGVVTAISNQKTVEDRRVK